MKFISTLLILLLSHAVAAALEIAGEMDADKHLVVCLSGRGDKDTHTVAEALGVELT